MGLTDAQHDALKRLKRKHPGFEKRGLDELGRQVVVLPGDEPERRRLRAITKTGIVERVAA